MASKEERHLCHPENKLLEAQRVGSHCPLSMQMLCENTNDVMTLREVEHQGPVVLDGPCSPSPTPEAKSTSGLLQFVG